MNLMKEYVSMCEAVYDLNLFSVYDKQSFISVKNVKVDIIACRTRDRYGIPNSSKNEIIVCVDNDGMITQDFVCNYAANEKECDLNWIMLQIHKSLNKLKILNYY